MNYRHAFHAGNFADVMKHALLARIVTYLNLKPSAWRFLDSHAGVGVYDLAGKDAERTEEWRNGIGRLEASTLRPDEAVLFAPYLDCVSAVRREGPSLYPGSPELARRLARPQDRLTLSELHPDAARSLAKRYAAEKRAMTLAGDGWQALKANLPPPERRGLVLIDPPFERQDEFAAIVASLATAHRKWRTGLYALWYPLKDLRAVGAFRQGLIGMSVPNILDLRLRLDDPAAAAGLVACGMVIVNPPFTLEAEARTMLAALARILGTTSDAGFSIEWLAGERG